MHWHCNEVSLASEASDSESAVQLVRRVDCATGMSFIGAY